MKSLTKTVALAALMTGVVGSAHAVEGWYGSATAGYSVDGGLDFNDYGQADFKNDWFGAVALGHSIGEHWRLEGEISARQNDLDPDATFLSGDARAYAAMANLYYDFLPHSWFQPYVGVGVGAARVNAKGTAVAPFTLASIDDSDTGLAYQAMVGAAFALTDRLDLDVGYRYFEVPDLTFDGTVHSTSLVAAFPDTATSFDADYKQQAVTVGLRWQFAAPAAPPPPPAPPAPPPPPPVATCPQSDFVVYFEWDRSNLNQSALEVIDSAVARARECNISGVTLVGHTDTSGTPQYNIALSERRASVVRDALVARGLTATAINTQAVGETDLARPTADGVREPLNRRTAVTISFQ